jgi:hypothetical protein
MKTEEKNQFIQDETGCDGGLVHQDGFHGHHGGWGALGLLSTSSLPIWAGIIWIILGNSQNPPQGGQGGRRHLKLAPDFLERNLGFPELKGSPFFLSGEGFASGNLDPTHGELKLIFSNLVPSLKYTAKTKVLCLGR